MFFLNDLIIASQVGLLSVCLFLLTLFRFAVGELFMGDAGLLGVVCFCHNSHMSVPKFCEVV